MFPENKQNKQNQTKKNERKEESYLKYTIIIKYAFCFLIFFSLDKLAKHASKNVCFHLLIYSQFLLQSQYKRGMGVYKVFNSNDLTLLFYSVYIYFILDLRRDNNKYNCVYFQLKQQFIIRYNKQTIIVSLFLKGYIILNIVYNCSKGFAPCPPLRSSQ